MIKCQICNKEYLAIMPRHLASHSMTRQQYIEKFPDALLQSPESSLKRANAKALDHAKKSVEEKTEIGQRAAATRVANGFTSWNDGKSGYKLEWSNEAKERIKQRGAPNKGQVMPDEQKKKQSKTMTAKYESGEIAHWNIGNITPIDVRNKISETCSKYELTSEQRARHLAAIRIWVKSDGYVPPMQNKNHTNIGKANISAGVIGESHKIRKSMEEGGYWIPLDKIPEFVKYKRAVAKLTEKSVHLIPGYDPLKRGRCNKVIDAYQIDHRFSVFEGWIENMTPEQIAHPTNLCFIPWRENLAKWHRSSISKDQLLNEINEYQINT